MVSKILLMSVSMGMVMTMMKKKKKKKKKMMMMMMMKLMMMMMMMMMIMMMIVMTTKNNDIIKTMTIMYSNTRTPIFCDRPTPDSDINRFKQN